MATLIKIVVVNKSQSDIYLKESSYEKYKSKLNQGFGAPAKAGPHFFFHHRVGGCFRKKP